MFKNGHRRAKSTSSFFQDDSTTTRGSRAYASQVTGHRSSATEVTGKRKREDEMAALVKGSKADATTVTGSNKNKPFTISTPEADARAIHLYGKYEAIEVDAPVFNQTGDIILALDIDPHLLDKDALTLLRAGKGIAMRSDGNLVWHITEINNKPKAVLLLNSLPKQNKDEPDDAYAQRTKQALFPTLMHMYINVAQRKAQLGSTEMAGSAKSETYQDFTYCVMQAIHDQLKDSPDVNYNITSLTFPEGVKVDRDSDNYKIAEKMAKQALNKWADRNEALESEQCKTQQTNFHDSLNKSLAGNESSVSSNSMTRG